MGNKKFIFILGISLLVIFSGFFIFSFFKGGRSNPLNFFIQQKDVVTVEYGMLPRTVRVENARVVPEKTWDLAFPLSGTIESVLVEEGSMVDHDQPLVKLNTSQLELSLKKTEALLQQSQDTLEKSLENKVPLNKSEAYQATLDSGKKAVINALQDAYARSDNSIRNTVDQFMVHPRSSHPELAFSLKNDSLRLSIKSERKNLEIELNAWSTSVHALTSGSNLENEISVARQKLARVSQFLQNTALAVNTLKSGDGISETTLDTWRTGVATARTSIATAQTNITDAEYSWKTGQQGHLSAQSDYDLLQDQIRRSTIVSPENALIVKEISLRQGEFAAVGVPVIRLASKNLVVQAEVLNEDMAGISENSLASFQPDAFPGHELQGRVSRIYPNEIIRDGSVYYQVEVTLDTSEDSLLSGMEGSLNILSSTESMVLRIPSNVLFDGTDGEKYVKLIKGRSEYNTNIIIGYSSGGRPFVEVISGLKEGDKILPR